MSWLRRKHECVIQSCAYIIHIDIIAGKRDRFELIYVWRCRAKPNLATYVRATRVQGAFRSSQREAEAGSYSVDALIDS